MATGTMSANRESMKGSSKEEISMGKAPLHILITEFIKDNGSKACFLAMVSLLGLMGIVTKVNT